MAAAPPPEAYELITVELREDCRQLLRGSVYMHFQDDIGQELVIAGSLAQLRAHLLQVEAVRSSQPRVPTDWRLPNHPVPSDKPPANPPLSTPSRRTLPPGPPPLPVQSSPAQSSPVTPSRARASGSPTITAGISFRRGRKRTRTCRADVSSKVAVSDSDGRGHSSRSTSPRAGRSGRQVLVEGRPQGLPPAALPDEQDPADESDESSDGEPSCSRGLADRIGPLYKAFAQAYTTVMERHLSRQEAAPLAPDMRDAIEMLWSVRNPTALCSIAETWSRVFVLPDTAPQTALVSQLEPPHPFPGVMGLALETLTWKQSFWDSWTKVGDARDEQQTAAVLVRLAHGRVYKAFIDALLAHCDKADLRLTLDGEFRRSHDRPLVMKSFPPRAVTDLVVELHEASGSLVSVRQIRCRLRVAETWYVLGHPSLPDWGMILLADHSKSDELASWGSARIAFFVEFVQEFDSLGPDVAPAQYTATHYLHMHQLVTWHKAWVPTSRFLPNYPSPLDGSPTYAYDRALMCIGMSPAAASSWS
jgi:hypothetical protein